MYRDRATPDAASRRRRSPSSRGARERPGEPLNQPPVFASAFGSGDGPGYARRATQPGRRSRTRSACSKVAARSPSPPGWRRRRRLIDATCRREPRRRSPRSAYVEVQSAARASATSRGLMRVSSVDPLDTAAMIEAVDRRRAALARRDLQSRARRSRARPDPRRGAPRGDDERGRLDPRHPDPAAPARARSRPGPPQRDQVHRRPLGPDARSRWSRAIRDLRERARAAPNRRRGRCRGRWRHGSACAGCGPWRCGCERGAATAATARRPTAARPRRRGRALPGPGGDPSRATRRAHARRLRRGGLVRASPGRRRADAVCARSS